MSFISHTCSTRHINDLKALSHPCLPLPYIALSASIFVESTRFLEAITQEPFSLNLISALGSGLMKDWHGEFNTKLAAISALCNNRKLYVTATLCVVHVALFLQPIRLSIV